MFVIRINRDRCKSCGLCIECCPRKLLGLDTELNRRGVLPVRFEGEREKCTGCCNCATICPDAAIEVIDVPDDK